MIYQQTLCGICSRSHGVSRYRLNLEAFKFQLIIIPDRSLTSEKLGVRLPLQKYRLIDESVCVTKCIYWFKQPEEKP